MDWTTVGTLSDMQANLGVCALVAGKQIALFYLPADGAIYALGNYDPIGKANVLSRGIVGDVQGRRVVASPLYKHHYDLQTGECLEDSSVRVEHYAVQLQGERVCVCLA